MLGSLFLDLFFLDILKTFKFLWEFLEGITEWKNAILVSFQVSVMGMTMSVWFYVRSLITSLMVGSWGPAFLEYTAPGMFVPSFSFRTHSVSHLEWDFCWLPLMKSRPQACLISPFLSPPLAQAARLTDTTMGCFWAMWLCTLLWLLAWSSACCMAGTLEMLAEWIERMSVGGYPGSSVPGRGWLGRLWNEYYGHAHPRISWKPKPRAWRIEVSMVVFGKEGEKKREQSRIFFSYSLAMRDILFM